LVSKSEQIVEHLFRSEYGKLLAVLTRIFGPAYLQLAEDTVQETLIAALDHWSTEGVPANPTGWLVQVARRKALNEINRNKMMQRHHRSGALAHGSSHEIGLFFLITRSGTASFG